MAEENFDKKETKKSWDCCSSRDKQYYRGGSDAWGWVYFLGVIGTAVYYVQQVSGFWLVVLAILKAIVWPAFLLYKVFQLLGM